MKYKVGDTVRVNFNLHRYEPAAVGINGCIGTVIEIADRDQCQYLVSAPFTHLGISMTGRNWLSEDEMEPVTKGNEE